MITQDHTGGGPSGACLGCIVPFAASHAATAFYPPHSVLRLSPYAKAGCHCEAAHQRGQNVGSDIAGYPALKGKYIDQLSQRLEAIQTDIMTVAAAPEGDTGDAVHRIYDALHRISGSAGSFGLVQLGMAARACADVFLDHIDGPQAMTPDKARTLCQAFADFNCLAQDAIAAEQGSQRERSGQ